MYDPIFIISDEADEYADDETNLDELNERFLYAAPHTDGVNEISQSEAEDYEKMLYDRLIESSNVAEFTKTRKSKRTAFKFVDKNIPAYFRKRYEELKKMVDGLSLDAFASDRNGCIADIKNLCTECGDIYIYFEPYGTVFPLDEFLRGRYVSHKDRVFFVKDVFEYHH